MKTKLSLGIRHLGENGVHPSPKILPCFDHEIEGGYAQCQLRRAQKFRRHSSCNRQQGYILLTLMFLATLVILSLAVLMPQLTQQIKRDQEEELIHRGVQYSRAIQHFYKKTGRYPVRIEELDGFNNMRFLRKHYKDPLTGKDFKLLHFGEVQMFGTGGAGMPGAAASNAAAFGGGLTPGLTNQSPNAQRFSNTSAMNQPGLNPQGQPPSQSSSDESSNDSGMQPVAQLASKANSSNDSPQATDANESSGSNQVFGGGPIVGVASTSSKKSIREFNKKNHYKDWQFIYDPSSDRGGLLNSPAQPNLNQSMNNGGQNNGQAGPAQGQGLAPQGQQPNNFGQQPNGFGQQNMPTPNQPPDQMQPQEQ